MLSDCESPVSLHKSAVLQFSSRDQAILNSRGHPYASKNSKEMVTANSVSNECRGECCRREPEPSRRNDKSHSEQLELTLSASNLIEEHTYKAKSSEDRSSRCCQAPKAQSVTSSIQPTPKTFTILRMSSSDDNSQRQATVVTKPVNDNQATALGVQTIPRNSTYSSDNKNSPQDNFRKANSTSENANCAALELTASDSHNYEKISHGHNNNTMSELIDDLKTTDERLQRLGKEKYRELSVPRNGIPSQSNTSSEKWVISILLVLGSVLHFCFTGYEQVLPNHQAAF